MTRLRTTLLVVALGAGIAGLLAGDASTVGAPRPVWNEVKWPFPLDQWGLGKAYRCGTADCGTECGPGSTASSRPDRRSGTGAK